MKQKWDEYCAQIRVPDEQLETFIDAGGLSSLQGKKLKKFTDEWNRMKKLAEALDKFITPVDPIKVESWCDQDDFRYMWRMWKDYLMEQHGFLIRSRMEQASLDFLQEISEGNVDKAISCIRFAMKGGYRSFFKVDEKTKSQPEKVTNEDTW
ncbi:hypothetical protein [Mangrovibacterium sp.]|uniref:hypothetical protein n=1 Tax=Mangrovibacterium sp. TaxID=1961364 RepID=UPI00356A2D72